MNFALRNNKRRGAFAYDFKGTRAYEFLNAVNAFRRHNDQVACMSDGKGTNLFFKVANSDVAGDGGVVGVVEGTKGV